MYCSIAVAIEVFPSGSITSDTIYLSFDVDEREDTEAYHLVDRSITPAASYNLDGLVLQPHTLVDYLAYGAPPPLLPTRHYGACLGGPELASSANVLAVRVTRSAAGYPVDVYGHVFVRDDLDCKRVYIFRRGRHNCQRINSKDEVLTLTGPSRGLLLRRHVHFEINLKSKSRQAEDDRDIARCCLMNDVTTSSSKVVRNRIAGRLCMVDLTYAPVHHAVEATVELKFDEILTTTRVSRRGNAIREWVPFSQVQSKEHPEFHGKVIVSISGVPEEIVLYDSEADGTVTAVSDEGFIQLSRCAVSVPICGRLSLKLTTGEHNVTSLVGRASGCDTFILRNTFYQLSGKVTWSLLYSPKVDGLPSSWFLPLESFSESM
ncbi:hypothetical protein QYE76_058559 [Lolium multiflorum]|uniref:DUF6598 domain-containing protein n=1 Tax=Lolium multiflorum TaxID=4521 RepID=A0AAD8T6P3_LOLMU|nr:hypothetical protein QYE76_058559 [Lolium multiflorum]